MLPLRTWLCGLDTQDPVTMVSLPCWLEGLPFSVLNMFGSLRGVDFGHRPGGLINQNSVAERLSEPELHCSCPVFVFLALWQVLWVLFILLQTTEPAVCSHRLAPTDAKAPSAWRRPPLARGVVSKGPLGPGVPTESGGRAVGGPKQKPRARGERNGVDGEIRCAPL